MTLLIRKWLVAVAIGLGCSVLSRGADVPPSPRIVMLASEEPRPEPNTEMGLLVRELARQAVLIAARDELGLQTRDQTLREPFPADAGEPIEIHIVAQHDVSMRIELTRKGGAEAIWNGQVPIRDVATGLAEKIPLPNKVNYIELAANLEPLTRGRLVEALQKAGFSAVKSQGKSPEDAAARASALLDQFYFLPQFRAVRTAHTAIANGDTSPALSGVLVRGYANLGQLTLPYWNATPKVFIARSLLYAQRMVNADSRSPIPLWHRAYARALAGWHVAALDDLRAADELANGQKAPPWVALIKALSKSDTRQLMDAAAVDETHAPLAMYLSFLTIEYSDSQSLVMQVGQAARDVNPQCFRLVEAMSAVAGVGPGHELTGAGHRIVLAALTADAQNFPVEAWDIVTKRLKASDPDALTVLAAATKALLHAGDKDTAEPSWGVLGRMVQEMNFLSVRRMVNFQRNMLGVDPEDYLRAALPLIEDHPYRAEIQAMALKPGGDPAVIKQLGKGIKVVDAELNESDLLTRFDLLSANCGAPGVSNNFALSRHTDALPRDLYQRFALLGRVKNWPNLQRVISPESAWAIAALIGVDWPTIGPKAAELETQYGNHPDVRAALARKYLAMGQRDNTIRNLQEYIKRAADPWAFQQLADLYLTAGDEDKWLSTLQEFLTKPDFGLNHAVIQAAIARHYAGKNDYKTALPYADAAARTGAQWAIELSADCHGALGQWDAAEELMADDADRYDPPALYMWCRATGHGNVDRGRQIVLGAKDRTDPYQMGGFYLLENDPEHAMESFRACLGRRGYYADWAAIFIALILDEKGDAAGRDQSLVAMTGDPKANEHNGQALAIAKEMSRLLVGGINVKTDRSIAETVLPAYLTKRAGISRFLTGKFLAIHGQRELAEEYLQHCFYGEDRGNLSQSLAAAELQKMGVARPYGQTRGN